MTTEYTRAVARILSRMSSPPLTGTADRSSTLVVGFVAGFFGTLVFHQLLIGALWLAGVLPRPPYSLAPVPPFGVPAVISLAFWGGLWGIVLLWVLQRWPTRMPALAATVFGAVLPPLVGWFVVAPIKGRAVSFSVRTVLLSAGINAVWGLGTWCVARMLARRAPGERTR